MRFFERNGRMAAISRSPAFIAALVSLGVSGIAAPSISGLIARHNMIAQAREEEGRKAVSRFVLEAEAFGPFATSFILAVSRDNKVDQQAYDRLAGNIVSQQATLDALSPKVGPSTRERIANYNTALLALNSAMQKVKDVESMKDFWERTSDLLVIRRELIPRLEADVT